MAIHNFTHHLLKIPPLDIGFCSVQLKKYPDVFYMNKICSVKETLHLSQPIIPATQEIAIREFEANPGKKVH
jgi:hypothetical protein